MNKQLDELKKKVQGLRDVKINTRPFVDKFEVLSLFNKFEQAEKQKKGKKK